MLSRSEVNPLNTAVCILLVEDDFLIRLLMSECLTDAGFNVVAAESGDQAITLLGDRGEMNLVVTDIQMSGTADGNKVAQAAKLRYPGVPVIYITGNSTSLTNVMEGKDALMRKPFSPDEMLVVAQQLLGI